MSEVRDELLKQTKQPMKPAKRGELLGGKRKSLDQMEYEDEMAMQRFEMEQSQR